LRLTRIVLLVAACACGLLSASAAHAAPVSPNEAERTLEQAEALLSGDRISLTAGVSPPGREATAVLRRLQESLRALDPAERRQAKQLLARPGDGAKPDPFGKEAAASPICDAQFCVHWSKKARVAPPKADKAPANGIPDFVDEVAVAAAQSYAVENEALGWRVPLSDGRKGQRKGKGADGQVDIYLDALGSGLFGYANTDTGSKGKRRPGFLVVDNDYDGFKGSPLELMRATMAHEYNHVVQFAINLDLDLWMFESTATWMEEQVYPDINDYVNFLDGTINVPEAPLAETPRRAFKLYGSAVWNHYLTRGYGPEVVRAAWEAGGSVSPRDFAVAAYERAIQDAGGPGFSQEFVGFAAATAEWRSSDVVPDPGLYKDVRRAGKLGGRGQKGRLDHTGYQLFRVDRPASGDLVLDAKLQSGARWGVALVGRAGPVIGGTVETELAYAPNGGKASVTLADAGRFNRITAVIANADGRLEGRSGDYRADGKRFGLTLGG
jgi:hypothetical protein